MLRGNLRLGARIAMPRCNIARISTLLQKLLHHAKRNIVSLCNLLARAILTVIGSDNALSEIFR